MTTYEHAIIFTCMKLGFAIMKLHKIDNTRRYELLFNARGKDEECFSSFVREMRNIGYFITEADLISKTNFIIRVEKAMFTCNICKKTFKNSYK